MAAQAATRVLFCTFGSCRARLTRSIRRSPATRLPYTSTGFALGVRISRLLRVGALASVLACGLLPASAIAASPSPSASSSASPSPTAKAAPSKATWGIGPAKTLSVGHYEVDADRASFKWFVTPGGELSDHVAIVNLSATPLTLRVYTRDAENDTDGKLQLQPFSGKPTDAATWITVGLPGGAASFIIPARSTAYLPVTLNIPANASPGDHTAGIISSLTAQVTGAGAQTINPDLEQRVAVPVQIRVSGAVNARLGVRSVHPSYAQALNPIGHGRTTITYTVANTGNVNLGAHASLVVTSWLGASIHVPVANIPVLLPGGSDTVTVELRGVLPEVFMNAKVSLAPLVPTSDVDPNIVASGNSKHFLAIPWMLIGIILLIIVAFWGYRRMRRGSGKHGQNSTGGRRRAAPKTAGKRSTRPSSVTLPAEGSDQITRTR